MTSDSPFTQVASGVVVDPGGGPLVGVVVAVVTWATDQEQHVELARVVSGDDGVFEISWPAEVQQTHVALVVLDQNADIVALDELIGPGPLFGEIQLSASAQSAGNAQLPQPTEPTGGGSVEEDGVTAYVVTGTVSSPSSASVGGLAVQLVDKNVGGDVDLVSGTTGNDGRYGLTARLSFATLRARHKSMPDLQTQVLQDGKVIASSIVRYQATTKEELDVVLPATTTLLSEYETLTTALAAAYPGSLVELEESATRQDITYLANRSGWDARAVAMASLATELSQAGGNGPSPTPGPTPSAQTSTAVAVPSVEPAFYYALMRAGLPTDSEALHRTPPAVVSSIWDQALSENVIPATLGAQTAQALRGFVAVASQTALGAPPAAGPSNLGQLLQITFGSVNATEQQQFAELLVQYGDDTETLWSEAESTFGASVVGQLQLVGQLAYLTANNAPLITALYQAQHDHPLTSAADLVTLGFYDASAWLNVMGDVAPPAEVPGADEAEQKANYAEFMAAQVRLSYPTAMVGQMAVSGQLGDAASSSGAGAFLLANPDFDIGGTPVDQYVAANHLSASGDVVNQVARLQRVYQITPTNTAMTALLNAGVDSAYAVCRLSESAFVDKYGSALGGTDVGQSVYRRAQVIHASTLHLTLSYLSARRQPAIGSGVMSSLVQDSTPTTNPTPSSNGSTTGNRAAPPAAAASAQGGTGAPAESNGGTPPTSAQATLDALFGNLDYCQCDDCRSITSAAAYLVDLLDWINITSPTAGGSNPQQVLAGRRPDIFALPLTCDNTNTALPYLDLANEVLEYYIGNTMSPESLDGFAGYNDDGTVSSAELTASPQNDNNSVAQNAYQLLKTQYYPSPLPFYRDLELLRLHVARFGISLYELMEVMRTSEDLERSAPTASDPSPYAWRDIQAERLGLSRLEYELLTDSTLTLAQLYGTGSITELSSLQEYSRRTGVAYTDIVSILETRFVNPGSWLLNLVDALDLTYATLESVNAGTMTAAALGAALPPNLVYTDYGSSGVTGVEAWIKANFTTIGNLIVIDVGSDPCNTETMTLQYLNGSPLAEIDFVRLMRFIRLWQKLGLTIQQTDDLIGALYVSTAPGGATALQQLDSGFSNLLPSAGIAYQAIDLLGLDPSTDLDALLACWVPFSDIGPNSLYAQMFLNPTVRNLDQAFTPDPNGEIFTGMPAPTLFAHQPAIMAALNLAAGEFDLITGAAPLGLGYDASTALSLGAISEIFRRAWLARTLGLSVLELLSLIAYTAVDPFAPPEVSDTQPVFSPLLDFIRRAQALTAAGLAPVQALYLLWDTDLSGVSAPSADLTTALAGSLRAAFVAIDSQFSVGGHVTAATAQALMALVLGTSAADVFFGLVNETFVTSVPFGYSQSSLPAAIVTAGNGLLTYDDLAKRLSFSGSLSPAVLSALQTAAAGDPTLLAAINTLAAANAQAVQTFFVTYDDPHAPYLKPLFDTYVATTAGPTADRAAALATLLNGLLPVLGRLRKQEQALACATTGAGCDPSFAPALLDVAAAIPASNPSAATVTDPTPAGVADLTAFDQGGLSVQFFLTDNPALPPDQAQQVAPSLAYGPADPLPAPTGPATTIAAQWNGYICANQNGDFNLNFTVDTGATVTLTVAGQPVTLGSTPGPGTTVFANDTAIALLAGALTPIEITATGLVATFVASWQTLGTGWQTIPADNLYSDILMGYLQTTFLRFLKATALAGDLSLDAAETAWLATDAGLTVGGKGWLAVLDVDAPAPAPSFAALTAVLDAVVAYATLKAAYSPLSTKTPQLLTTLRDVAAGTAGAPSELLALTGWDPSSLQPLLGRLFGLTTTSVPVATTVASFGALPDIIANVVRLRQAFAVVTTCGLSAPTLIEAATNDPSPPPGPPPAVPPVLSDFQSAVRSRYNESDWLRVVQPINDSIREIQRDALVAYVLVQSGPAMLSVLGITTTANRRPTSDDLYNYFLLDVEMEACMQTSRVRLALSSIQLFVERCLRNLEPAVNPGDLDGTQWEWRKRYRVWQANREVFLWPENWLDPSFRDDQSPFFKTTMSQLLQSDITDDTAVATYLDYLSNLELVAKLEPCGLYYDETAQVGHVIARNGGAHRKYYYRRFENNSWSPWEETKLNIEDVPVVPYVWNGRLLVFWLQLQYQSSSGVSDLGTNLPQDPSGAPGLASVTVGELSSSVANSATKLAAQKVGAVLCFSEYYNGAWQPTKTSDPKRPLTVADEIQGQWQVDRTQLFVRPWLPGDGDDSLYVQVTWDELPAFLGDDHGWNVWGATGSPDLRGFVLHNTHSPPVTWDDVPATYLSMPAGVRELLTGTWPSTLSAVYGGLRTNQATLVSPDNVAILTGELPQAIEAAQPDVTDQTYMPFFFGDPRSVFYVTTSTYWRLLGGFNGYGMTAAQIGALGTQVSIPPIVVATGPAQPDPPNEVVTQSVDGAVAQRAVDSGQFRAVIGGGSRVVFGDRSIGVTGSTAATAPVANLDGQRSTPNEGGS